MSRLTPERLAELRRIATGEDWSPPQPEDLAALLAERDRLAAQIAADADEDHVLEERAELSRAVGEERGRRAAIEHEHERVATELAKAIREAEHWRGVAAKRKADREQLVAAILRLKQEPRIPLDAWYAYATVLEMARGTKLALRDGATVPQVHEFGYQLMERGQGPMMIGRPEADVRAAMTSAHERAPECRYGLRRRVVGPWVTVEELGEGRDGAQAHAPGPWAGFADGEAAEAQETAQRGSEGFENYRCPTDCDPDCGMRCHEDHQVEAKQTHDVRECQARRAAAETYRRVMTPYRPFSGLVIDEESARTGVLPGSLEAVIALAQAPVIAPEDEGISTTDVMAQAAADAPPDLRTPDQWCAEYDIRILDPDGWRGTHRLAWDFPISLAEFWRRSRTSTTDAVNPAWTRVAADAARTDTESEQQ